jgi:glycerophosphoryl diester phosphodiesterase
MKTIVRQTVVLTLLCSASMLAGQASAQNVQLGPRPYFLIDAMDESDLKTELQQCVDKPAGKSDFSIGHRGAPLMFPEHTVESNVAAAQMVQAFWNVT